MAYRLEMVQVGRCRNEHNIRQQFDDEEIRLLAESLKERQINPIALTSELLVIDGGKRVRSALFGGIKELLAVITDDPLTPEELTGLQIVAAFHRSDPKPVEQWRAMEAFKAAHAGWTNKELAAALKLDPKMVKILTSPSLCVPEVQTALEEGRIGLSVCHELSLLEPEPQRSLLQLKLAGASRDEIARQGRKQRSGTVPPAERTKRSTFPRPSGVTVSLAGGELSLEDAAGELSELATDMRRAAKDGISIKTFAANCRDRVGASV